MWNLKKILCWPESSLSDELFARLFTKWLLENGIGLNQGHINRIKRRNHPYTFQYYNKIKMRHLLSFSCFGINVMSGCLFFSGYKFLFPIIRLSRLSTRCGVATRINLVLFNIKWTKLCNKRFCVQRFFLSFKKLNEMRSSSDGTNLKSLLPQIPTSSLQGLLLISVWQSTSHKMELEVFFSFDIYVLIVFKRILKLLGTSPHLHVKIFHSKDRLK